MARRMVLAGIRRVWDGTLRRMVFKRKYIDKKTGREVFVDSDTVFRKERK